MVVMKLEKLMSDLLSIVSSVRRPRLLIRAARAGLVEYNRNRDLKRLTRMAAIPTPDRALKTLIAEEERIEESRQSGDGTYNLTRHIELLIAMMGEVRLLPRPGQA
jgi:hypothetical protein